MKTNTKNKSGNGRFTKGSSGNPSGRPLGSRNKETLMMEALLGDEAEPLMRKTIEVAKTGDTQALRLCLSRLMPPVKDRVVFFELPPIRSPEDIPAGMMSIISAISNGQITPPEGEVFSRILTDYATIMTTQDLELRVQKLEHRLPVNDPQVTIVQN